MALAREFDPRGRVLAWLARGAQDIAWAVASLPPERWLALPPRGMGDWSAARHVRHLAVRDTRLTLPAVRVALGVASAQDLASPPELHGHDADWPTPADESIVDDALRALGEARFELLRQLESASDAAWERPLPDAVAPTREHSAAPVGLGWLLARSYQHELEHLGAVWRLVLYWDRATPPSEPSVSLPLHPADRVEESH